MHVGQVHEAMFSYHFLIKKMVMTHECVLNNIDKQWKEKRGQHMEKVSSFIPEPIIKS